MTEPNNPIRDEVRKHYAEIARSSSSCCGGEASCSEPASLYNPEAIAEMPGEISTFSLGCGDPVTIAGIQPGETVLDLGSGGGLDCFLAAQRTGPSGQVIGVDMTPEMLTKARAAAKRIGVANVDFREGYLEALPVEDATIDLVISNCVVNLSPDKPQVFREIFRVLKPGGRVSISDTVTDGPISAELRANMEAWSACVSGSLDVSVYKDELAKAGFTGISIQPKDLHSMGPATAPADTIYSALISAQKPGRA